MVSVTTSIPLAAEDLTTESCPQKGFEEGLGRFQQGDEPVGDGSERSAAGRQSRRQRFEVTTTRSGISYPIEFPEAARPRR